jgi:hypothetical protein
MKKQPTPRPRTLVLETQVLRTLTERELIAVAGGGMSTGEYSRDAGCEMRRA